MASKQLPIPQNPIGESFAWRDWFQKLSDRVFGTASSIDVPILPQYGGTGKTSYNVGDILYADGTTSLSKLSIGASGYMLTSTGTAPAWTAAPDINSLLADRVLGWLSLNSGIWAGH